MQEIVGVKHISLSWADTARKVIIFPPDFAYWLMFHPFRLDAGHIRFRETEVE